MSEIVVWPGSRRITSLKMENAENSFKINKIRPVNLPFIQEEITLRWISDVTAIRTGNNAKMGFLSVDHDLRDTIVKVRHREILYRTMESVKRQPVMTYVARISKTFMNQNAIKLVIKVLSSKPTLSAISKLHFKSVIECRKSDVKSAML